MSDLVIERFFTCDTFSETVLDMTDEQVVHRVCDRIVGWYLCDIRDTGQEAFMVMASLWPALRQIDRLLLVLPSVFLERYVSDSDADHILAAIASISNRGEMLPGQYLCILDEGIIYKGGLIDPWQLQAAVHKGVLDRATDILQDNELLTACGEAVRGLIAEQGQVDALRLEVARLVR
jgi:hypothetical protein